MDIASVIGSAAVVTQQTGQQINPQKDQVDNTGVAAGNNQSAQQQIINETRSASHGAAQNGENGASNDDARGNDNDKDNATTQSLSGVGANLDITA